MEIKKMNVGEVLINEKSCGIGICYEVRNGTAFFLMETGAQESYPVSKVVFRAKKGINEKKQVLKEAAKDCQQIDKITDEITALIEKRRGYQESVRLVKDKCFHADGLLTESEFLSAFKKELSSTVRNRMEENRFRIYIDPYYSKKDLTVETDVFIQKYCRESDYSFLFTEYDGTLMMETDAEKCKDYKAVINRYSRNLRVGIKPEERLGIGDKNTLIYDCCYEIPLKKSYTIEYAKELAKKFQ